MKKRKQYKKTIQNQTEEEMIEMFKACQEETKEFVRLKSPKVDERLNPNFSIEVDAYLLKEKNIWGFIR